MHSDRVSTTGSESRKSSKPIMEKRRRARINASLAELKSLLLEVIKKEGARHSKMEKADILEMAVKHLRQIQRQQFTGSGSDPTLTDKYRLGFNECAQEVSRYLGASDDDDAELRARLLNHLANCIASSDSPSPVSTPSTSPAPAPLGHTLGSVAPPASSSNAVTVTPLTPIPVRPAAAKPPAQAFSLAPQPSTGGVGGGLPPSATVLVPASEINNNNASLANNNLIGISSSTGSDVSGHHVSLTSASPGPTLHVPQATKVLGELQVVPPKTGSGEVAFVLPANVMAGGHLPSYIIPVYTSPPSLPANVSLSPNAPAPSTLPLQLPIMASPQVSAAVVANGTAPSFVTLTPGGGLIPPVSVAAGVIPSGSVGHVVATGFNGSFSWQSAPSNSNPSPTAAASVALSASSPTATVTSTVTTAEEASSSSPSSGNLTRDAPPQPPAPKGVIISRPSPVEVPKSETCAQSGQRGPRVPVPVLPDQGKDVWRPW